MRRTPFFTVCTMALLIILITGSVAFADALATIKSKGVLVAGVKDAVVPFGYGTNSPSR
jgi:polar amino acid transport system substrate-binding protein